MKWKKSRDLGQEGGEARLVQIFRLQGTAKYNQCNPQLLSWLLHRNFFMFNRYHCNLQFFTKMIMTYILQVYPHGCVSHRKEHFQQHFLGHFLSWLRTSSWKRKTLIQTRKDTEAAGTKNFPWARTLLRMNKMLLLNTAWLGKRNFPLPSRFCLISLSCFSPILQSISLTIPS